MKILSNVLNYIEKHGLIAPGDKVLSALSGGADSVCLTLILKDLEDILGFKLHACHINHSLRGEESDNDEKFSEKVCMSNSIPFYSIRVDVNEYALKNKIGTEEAARILRYASLKDVMETKGLNKIALAHNMDDQAETVLFRFLRGSSSKGLSGMQPMRDEIYIRPLLETKRTEIEEYLKSKGQDYRTDSTNLITDFTRNSIRLKLMPKIKELYNPEIIKTISDTADTMKTDSDYLDHMAKESYFKNRLVKQNRITLDKKLFSEHVAIASRAVLLSIEELKGSTQDISKVHIMDILKIAKGETGKAVDIPGNITVSNSYGNITFLDVEKEENDIQKKNVLNQKNKVFDYASEVKIRVSELFKKPHVDGTTVVQDADLEPIFYTFPDYVVKVRRVSKEEFSGKDLVISDDTVTIYLDMDKTKDLLIRTRRTGDKIRLLGLNGRKSIKSIFIDKKIERDLRDKLLLIVSGEKEVAFIYPDILSSTFRCDENTGKIISVEIRKISGENS